MRRYLAYSQRPPLVAVSHFADRLGQPHHLWINLGLHKRDGIERDVDRIESYQQHGRHIRQIGELGCLLYGLTFNPPYSLDLTAEC
jgi:hypothetical protein